MKKDPKKDPKITPELVSDHGISEAEYQKILEIMGREPNYTELGVFSTMWSEHCSYKSSKPHLKTFPTTGPQVIQGPGENAGIVDIGDGWAAVFKMESHNHPSYIEPYQGAATGVGGILRDIFTMGARTIASLNSLRFGSLDHPRTRYLVNGVVAGIGGYGNCMGVPTVGGEITFDESYKGNILVNAFALGIVRQDKIFKGLATGVGNPVLYVGSKTGRDGIHGATMASEEFDAEEDEEAASKKPTVQVGDPFTEKLLLEACLELMDKDYIVGIQDMGAAGLTCSSFEMAGRAGSGMILDLDKVPLRASGMSSYEIMLSESQERMLLVAKRGYEEKVQEIFHKWDLDAVVVGEVTDDGFMRVRYQGKEVAHMPVAPLSDQAPVYHRPQEIPKEILKLNDLKTSDIEEIEDVNNAFLKLIGSPNLACKRWVFEQYDHMVRTNTSGLPGGDAAVIRLKETGDMRKALAMTVDCNSRYCYLNPFTGGKIAIAENARNLACVGARPLGVTDCLNFGNPERPTIMWQFAEAVKGIGEACSYFDSPIVGGNVSFYNETNGVAIYPTPTTAMVGLIKDVSKAMTHWFKEPGDLIGLIGENTDEIGGSEFLAQIHKMVKGPIPAIDLERERQVQHACLDAIEQGLLASAHDCSEGGLAVAVAECCVSGPDHKEHLGAVLKVDDPIRCDVLLFGEGQSRIVVSFKESNLNDIEKICSKRNVPFSVIGTVGGRNLSFNKCIDLSLDLVYKTWRYGLDNYMAGKVNQS